MSEAARSAAHLATALAERIDALVMELFPAAKPSGNFWAIGDLRGTPGRSLAIRHKGPKAGRWCDYATGEYGDALDLIRGALGGDTKEAFDFARSFLGNVGTARPAMSPQEAPAGVVDESGARRIAWARALWRKARPAAGTTVQIYLASRGITAPTPATIRFVPNCRHTASQSCWPAMVAAVTRWPDRLPVGVHRTYLRPDGSGKAEVEPQKAMLGRVAGGAVRLAPAGGRLAVAEGIETALSAMQAVEIPAWAALSTSGLRTLVLPPEVSDVLILADNDRTGAGERAATDAAARWLAEGRRVRIAMPPVIGGDFNDLLLGYDRLEAVDA